MKIIQSLFSHLPHAAQADQMQVSGSRKCLECDSLITLTKFGLTKCPECGSAHVLHSDQVIKVANDVLIKQSQYKSIEDGIGKEITYHVVAETYNPRWLIIWELITDAPKPKRPMMTLDVWGQGKLTGQPFDLIQPRQRMLTKAQVPDQRFFDSPVPNPRSSRIGEIDETVWIKPTRKTPGHYVAMTRQEALQHERLERSAFVLEV